MASDLVTHSKIQKLPREHALVMNVVVIHPRTAIPCQSLHLEAAEGYGGQDCISLVCQSLMET